jgi:uncharacterized protein (UPF0303 family)
MVDEAALDHVPDLAVAFFVIIARQVFVEEMRDDHNLAVEALALILAKDLESLRLA